MSETEPDAPFLVEPRNAAFVAGHRRYPHRPSLLLCGLMAAFASVGFLPAGATWSKWNHFRELDARGVSTVARVIDRRVESDDDGTSYLILYEFSINGVQIHSRERVNKRVYHRAGRHPLRVRYLPEAPAATARVGERPTTAALLAASLFSSFWLLMCGGLLVALLVQRRRVGRLARAPRLSGRVVSVKASKDSEGDLVVELRYALTSPKTGAQLEGEDSRTRNDLARPPAIGTRVIVLYGGDEDLLPL